MNADNHTDFGLGRPDGPFASYTPEESVSLNGSVATTSTRERKFSLLSYSSTNRTTGTRDYGFTTVTPKRVQLVLAGILVCLITIAVILTWGSGLAQGAVIHKFERAITGVPAEGPHGEKPPFPGPFAFGPFGAPMTVGPGGNVYVADRGKAVVDEFSETGEYVLQLTGTCEKAKEPAVEPGACPSSQPVRFGEVAGVAVDDASGKIFVSTGSAVDIFGSSGEYLGQITEVPEGPSAPAAHGAFHETAGLAFDQASEELYIAVEGHEEEGGNPATKIPDVVDVFKREGPGAVEYERQFGSGILDDTGGGEQTVAIAEGGLGNAGTAYVGGGYQSVVDVFESLGDFVSPFSPWEGRKTPTESFDDVYIGIDPTTGRVYAADYSHGVVDEFEASTAENYLGRLTGTPSGSFGKPEAVAVPRTDQDVYVADYKENLGTGVVDVFGPDLLVPEVKAEAATEVGTGNATLNGKVTLATEKATCRFVWGTSASELNRVAPCEPQQVAGEEGEAEVHAKLTGLSSGTTYYYKLRATNTEDEAENIGETESVVSFTTQGPAFQASSESASDVSSSSATLHASVSANNAATSVFFEYGPCTSLSACASAGYPSHSAPEAIGAGDTPVNVEAHIQGLSAGTAYHYRVAATSLIEGAVKPFADGEEGTFTTQGEGSFALPDGRAWEMVSPPAKEGALIQGPGEPFDVLQAAADGGAMTYLTNVPTEKGVPGYANAQQVLSTRGPSGWSSKDLASPLNGAVGSAASTAGQEYRFFSEELTQGVLQPYGAFEPCQNSQGESQACFSPAASEQTAFLRDLQTGEYTPLVTACPKAGEPCDTAVREQANVPDGTVFGEPGVCPPARTCGPFFDGATPNASHIVFDSSAQLTAEEAPEGGLYEWNAEKPTNEQLQFIGKREGPGEKVSLGTFSAISNGAGKNARHAISEDGSRVFWTDFDEGYERLYMRDTVVGRTVEVGSGDALFQTASSDGSRVFFSEHGSLFECDIPASLECSPVRLGAAPPGENGLVIGASEDGSYVYWVSGANDGLYVDHYVGGEWQLRLIALLSGEDSPDWATGSPELAKLAARVSPDGGWVSFMSDRELTGYDNLDAASGRADEEVYLYDAQTGRLACASCNPSGARPVGVEYGREGKNMPLVGGDGYEDWHEPDPSSPWLSGWLPGWVSFELGVARYQPRYLSDSGRLFFDSDDALVPKDINGSWDVYEYEPENVPEGSRYACGPGTSSGSTVYEPARRYDTEGHEGESGAGCVGLISSGESAQESALLDVSAGHGEGEQGPAGQEAGADVFFMTTAQLSPRDFDNAYDVYDAHECTTASPCHPESAPAVSECTTAEACRAAPAPPPGVYGAPASATFSGSGNLAPPPPAKPAVKVKALTRAQKLAGALKQCKKDKKKAKRQSCEKAARKKYGPVKRHKAKKSDRKRRK